MKTDKSQLLIPGPRITGSVRLSLPNVNAEGTVKQDVLNQRPIRAWAEPSIFLSQPKVTLGRNPVLKPVRFGVAVKPSGKPVWKVLTPSMPHPEIRLPAMPRAFGRNFCPLPKGRSAT